MELTIARLDSSMAYVLTSRILAEISDEKRSVTYWSHSLPLPACRGNIEK